MKKSKIIITFTIIITSLFLGGCGIFTKSKSNGLIFRDIDSNTCEVIGYEEPISKKFFGFITQLFTKEQGVDIVIPSKYEGKKVVSIGSYAFSGCSSLESIVIPNSVTSIGQNAFSECSGLESIVIPNSVTSIGGGAFYECRNLTSIEIPNSVTSIGTYTFFNCTNLTSILIPDSVTSIAPYQFKYCTSLTNIEVDSKNEYYKSIDGNLYSKDGKTLIHYAIGKKDSTFYIPSSVTSIEFEAFNGCSSLTSIIIPNSVTSIGSYAFSECSGLESIVIPDSVTSIGSSAFSVCSSLTIYCEATSQPSGWSSNWNSSNRPVYWGINETNFYEENGIQYVLNIETKEATISGYVGNDANVVINETIIVNDIEYSVRSIGESAFRGCSSLESIVIPDSVTSICLFAFRECSNLESVVIPESVTSIGRYAFIGCSSLTIYCEATQQPSGWNSNWNSSARSVIWGYRN